LGGARSGVDKAIAQLLEEHRATIIKRWREQILEIYKPEAAKFLRGESDPFANPVGASVRNSVDPIVDCVVAGNSPETVQEHVDSLVRIRAVQELEPSKSIGLFLALKGLIREILGRGIPKKEQAPDLFEVYERVDAVALLAFDIHSKCKEQIFEIRIREVRGRSERVLDKLNKRAEAREAAKPSPEGS